jgi:hypothetical protein
VDRLKPALGILALALLIILTLAITLRYEMARAGGEVLRFDRITGEILLCSRDECADLTSAKKPAGTWRDRVIPVDALDEAGRDLLKDVPEREIRAAQDRIDKAASEASAADAGRPH